MTDIDRAAMEVYQSSLEAGHDVGTARAEMEMFYESQRPLCRDPDCFYCPLTERA